MSIILEGKQITFVKEARSWFKNSNEQLYVLVGFAGTGKSTSVKYLLNELGLSEKEVIFGTPTGKAAKVLRSKGISTAKTTYSHFYRPYNKDKNLEYIDHYLRSGICKEMSDIGFFDIEDQIKIINDQYENLSTEDKLLYSNGGTVPLPVNLKSNSKEINSDLKFVLKSQLDDPRIKLIIIDEASMENDERVEDFLSFGIPVLLIGDSCQLPCIEGKNTYLNNPNILLDELHRAAENDPITILATKARKKQRIIEGSYGNNVLVVNRRRFENNDKLYNMLTTTDQVIAGYKKTVKFLNDEIRYLNGFTDEIFPMKDDKLICRKNNYDSNYMNGDFCFVTSEKNEVNVSKGFITLDIMTDEGKIYKGLKANAGRFSEEIDNSIYHNKLFSFDQFDYGYAITCNVSQGSEYENGILYSEPFGEKEKWLYTAITRFSKSLIMVI